MQRCAESLKNAEANKGAGCADNRFRTPCPFILFVDFSALDFLRRVFNKLLVTHNDFRYLLITRKLGKHAAYIRINVRPLKKLIIGEDFCAKLFFAVVIVIVYDNLLDICKSINIFLNFLGINIFTVVKHNDIFLAPGYNKLTALVYIPEIACGEPAVLNYLGCEVWAFVIAEHNGIALNADLPDAVLVLIFDFQLNARQRIADSAEIVVTVGIRAYKRRTFRDSVAVDERDSYIFEKLSRVDRYGRAAADNLAQSAAEPCMN